MQKLKFEQAWDKTIAEKDRKWIEQVFIEFKNVSDEKMQLTPLRQAINHKDELLVTVLIHNTSKTPLIFNKTVLAYMEEEKVLAEHTFTIPTLVVQGKTSMPWTFIFPFDSMKGEVTLIEGTLKEVEL